MNVKIGTEAAQFPEQEYNNGFFVAVQGAHTHSQDQSLKPTLQQADVLTS